MKNILITTLGILLLSISNAGAVDFSKQILDLDNKSVPSCSDKVPECEKPLTLGYISTAALLRGSPDEVDQKTGQSTISVNEKLDRTSLALKIHDCLPTSFPVNGRPEGCKDGDLKVSAEDVAKLKALISKDFSTLVVGRSFAILDPNSVKK